MENQRQFLRDLFRVLRRKGANGARAYADDDVRALVFVLCFQLGLGAMFEKLGKRLPKAIAMMIGEQVLAMGINPGDDATKMKEAVERYFSEHPLNPTLRAEVEEVLRGAASGAYGRSGPSFERFAGKSRKQATPPLPTGGPSFKPYQR